MTDFSSTGPNAGDLCIQGDQGFIGMKTGTAAVVPIGWAILNYTYLTDSQSLTIVLGDQGYFTGAATYIYTHSDTAHTVGTYCRIRLGQVQIGLYTRTGSVYSYTPFTGGTHILDMSIFNMQGTRVELRNVGTLWSVVVNGSLLFSLTNTTATFGSTYRTAAISMERKTSSTMVWVYPPGDFESFRIAGRTMNDRVQPAYAGSGAKMVKTDTGFDSGGLASSVFPSGFFNVIASNTEDITVDLINSKFTVSIAGWYKCDLRHASNIPDNEIPTAEFHHCLFKNGSLNQLGSARIAAFNGTNTVWLKGLQSTFTVYLLSGDYVQAGYGSSVSLSSMFQGETSGTENYFSIALLTRNLL